MGDCDLCNVSIGPSAMRVSAAEFRVAVTNGLRPRGTAAQLARAVGMPSDAWVGMAMLSPTDWALCYDCAIAFDGYRHGHGHKKRSFSAKTVEEAQANAKVAMAGMPAEKIVKLATSREPLEDAAVANGADQDAATKAAQARIPSEAFDVSVAEVVQKGGERGVVELEALSETEARVQWSSRKPPSSDLDRFECVAQPRGGFLGIGKKTGVWKAHWSIAWRVRITYRLPAEVTLTYKE